MVASCKDFKSWEATYASQVKIKFELEKDQLVPNVLKDLGSKELAELSFKLSKLPFTKTESRSQGFPIRLSGTSDHNGWLSIDLNPVADQVSFVLEDEGKVFYHKVTLYYDRIFSSISPEVGVSQIQYRIKYIQFGTKVNKRPIFKKSTIDNPVPLNEKKAKADLTSQENKIHVTLYY